MQITNSTSFRGKIAYGPGSEDMTHLVTKKVRDRIRVAPKGTELHLSRGISNSHGIAKLSTPPPLNNSVSALGAKGDFTAEKLLDILNEGHGLVKKGLKNATKGWNVKIGERS